MPPRKHNRGSKPRLSDLNGLQVCLILPPSPETQFLVKHLQRIGCVPVSGWPIPTSLPKGIDAAIVTVEPEHRLQIGALAETISEVGPPLIALVEYEDPSTLQLVLEIRAAAVIGRPVKPFGLLTNLMIARSSWQQRVDALTKQNEALEQQLAFSKVAVAKILLKQQDNISDDQAHRIIQKRAMDNRCSLETIATKIMSERAPEALLRALEEHAKQLSRTSTNSVENQ